VKPKPKFMIESHDTCDKSFRITGPSTHKGGLCLNVDYDDVDYDKVEKEAEKLVRILNEHW
jgi:hypothetical protein